MLVDLESDSLKVVINSFGAEIMSIKDKNGQEYMWQAGDAWKRRSPVLFPIVGGLNQKTYRYNGEDFGMGQHGFARDQEFTLTEQDETSCTFLLTENDETLKVYPFSFNLFITYTLEDSMLYVTWEVVNTCDKTMYFQIGGHPAFTCPLKDAKQTDCYLHFDDDELNYNFLSGDGLCINEFYDLANEDGYVKITEDFFDHDAYVMYNDRIRSVSLADSNKKDYLRVTFDAPVYGIWSAKGKHAPFVCIEPWFGRCDAVDFGDVLQEREFINELPTGETFEASYTIEVLQ